jgi:DNA-binding transcriptional ArsR family regulator
MSFTERVERDSVLRAIANPQRRAILQLVRDGERPAGEIAVECGLSGPATSQHLNSLRLAGLVRVRVDGKRRLYSVDFEALQALRSFLDDFWSDRLDVLKADIEAEAESGGRREAG